MPDEIKVLIVDDQAAARIQMKRIPVWSPHSRFVVAGEARNGREALQMLDTGDYQVLITDIRMPVMDGLELLEAIVKERPDIPVILQSDYADFEYARKGLIGGAFDYLIKPVSAEELLAVLDRVVVDRLFRENMLLTSNQIAKQIYQSITSGRALTDRQIMLYADWLKKKTGAAASEDSDWIRYGIELFLQLFPPDVLTIRVMDCVAPATAWAIRQPDAEEAFRRIIRFAERAYVDIMLPTSQNELVRRTVQIVLTENGTPKTVGSIADAMFVHRNHLSQTFSRVTGLTLADYLIRVKMYMARGLLLNPSYSVQDVSERLGYKDDEHFSKLFREHTGLFPREYRKRNS